MKTAFFYLLLGLGQLFGQDMKVFGKSNEESYAGKVVRIEIGENSLTNGQSFKFWERILERASDEEAKGIIFDLDTPGGLAFPTEELMTKIANVGIPTIAFVNPNAISAGSFIAVSTDRIYMTPGSKIGSSGIIDGSGREIDPVRRAKLESYFGAQIRYIAKQKGYNPEVIEAMMFLSDEKRVIGDVEVKPGSLLNLNSSEATRMMSDGPLLAEAEVTSLEELLKAEGWSEEEVITATPTGFERLAWWIAGFSGVLILVGLGGGYFELKTPGFGIGGIICLSAFALFFFGNYMAGNMAGYELAALFVIGIALIGVEVFVIPGFGVAGITGLFLLVGAVVFSMFDGVTWQTYQWGGSEEVSFADALRKPTMNLAIGIFGSLFLLFLMMRFLPKVSFIDKTMLPSSLGRGNGNDQEVGVGALSGRTGIAVTDLRPNGKAEVDGKLLEVLADGVFLDEGEPVRVISDDGMGVIVKRVKD
ncbi:MAG: NfeD family protein [Akkermansiaceae bacterium]|nr:NfeD family protein [Akkermansiaceae bacterium]